MSVELIIRRSNPVVRARHAYLLLLLPVVLACGLPALVKKAKEQKAEEQLPPSTIKSSDSTIQLTIPGGWRVETMNESAALQASHRVKEMYVVVLKENKNDNLEIASLDEYARVARNSMIASIQEPQATDPVTTSVGGYPAKEYQLEGIYERVRIKYICFAVDTPNHYYQIATWTMTSRFQKNEATLRQVAQSFKELSID